MLQEALQGIARWIADLIQLAYSSKNIFWKMLVTSGVATLLIDLIAMIFATKDD